MNIFKINFNNSYDNGDTSQVTTIEATDLNNSYPELNVPISTEEIVWAFNNFKAVKVLAPNILTDFLIKFKTNLVPVFKILFESAQFPRTRCSAIIIIYTNILKR